MIFFSSTLWWVLLIVELLAYFVMRLVQRGMGARKNQIEIVSFVIQMAVIILTFVLVDWKGGVALIIAVMIWSFPTEKIIHHIFKKIYPGSKYSSSKQPEINEMNSQLDKKLAKESLPKNYSELSDFFHGFDEIEQNKNNILNSVKKNSDILNIIKKYNKDIDDLEIIYTKLSMGGGNLADSVIQDPALIEEYFVMKANGESDIVVNYKLALTLGIIP